MGHDRLVANGDRDVIAHDQPDWRSRNGAVEAPAGIRDILRGERDLLGASLDGRQDRVHRGEGRRRLWNRRSRPRPRLLATRADLRTGRRRRRLLSTRVAGGEEAADW